MNLPLRLEPILQADRTAASPADLPDQAGTAGWKQRRARHLDEVQSGANRAQLGAARQARAAAEADAIASAAARAQAEAARLEQAEAALSAAAAATRQARADLERLRREEAECRRLADAQRAVTVQARTAERTLRQRHGLEVRTGQSADPLAALAQGFAPTLVQERAVMAPTLPDTDRDTDRDTHPDAAATPPPTTSPVLPPPSVAPEALPILSVVPSDASLRGEAANRPRVGTVLVEGQRLTPVDVEVVLMHQAAKPRRFGEIAVSLGLLEVSDVVWALRRQRPQPQATAGGMATPIAQPLVMRDRPDSPAAAVIRDIARQLQGRRQAGSARQALCVLSVGVGEGKSTVAANLAMALAEQGRRVLLLDTDTRRTRLKQMLPGLSASKGLAAVLTGRESLAQAIARPIGWSPQPRDLHALPAGDSLDDATPFARMPAFRQVLDKLLAHYDDVLIDTPAACLGPGGLDMACLVGPTLLVARPGHTRTAALDQLAQGLREGGAQVLGVVMNSH